MNSGGKLDSYEKQSDVKRLDDEFTAVLARADSAQARFAKAKAEADKAKAEADNARDEAVRKGEELITRIEAGEADANAADPNPRALLVKALGMLGSDQVGERAAAALVVETQRAKLGTTWDELIARDRNDEDEDLNDEDLDDDEDDDYEYLDDDDDDDGDDDDDDDDDYDDDDEDDDDDEEP